LLRWTGAVCEGRALDVSGIPPERLVAAVREPEGAVECPASGPAHEYVGLVREGRALSLRAALAAAARSRRQRAPQDRELARLERELAGLRAPDPETGAAADLRAAREAVAAAGEREEELAERVARLAGRVVARRDLDEAVKGVQEELREAAAALSEARTERLAAEQRRDAARERAREARDRRERRLRLEDRIENRRRAARAHLADALYGEFRAAVEAVPGAAAPGTEPAEYRGDDTTAALAVARTAALDAPVVLAAGRFPDAEAAADCLDAPVLRVRDGSGSEAESEIRIEVEV
jgi:chromosome segregation ATPase